LNTLVSYFVVASRNVKIGVGADQKDFLGDCYAENIGGSNEIWRYHRSELRPSQSDSKFSREI